MKKLCHKCGQEKELEDFSVSRRRKDGRQTVCRECFKSYQERSPQYHSYQRYYKGFSVRSRNILIFINQNQLDNGTAL